MDAEEFFFEQQRLCKEIERNRAGITERLKRKEAAISPLKIIPKLLPLALIAWKVKRSEGALARIAGSASKAVAARMGASFIKDFVTQRIPLFHH